MCIKNGFANEKKNILCKKNQDENVHRFALSALRGNFWREREKSLN